MAAAGAHDGSSSALLPLPLSLATKAPSRCSLVELRTEGVKLSCGDLWQRRADSAPPLPRGAADDPSEMLEMTVLHREVTS